MSELTSCNYCNLQRIKRNKPKGARVYLKGSKHGGLDVFIVPKCEKLDTRSPDDGGKHWKSWFMVLSDHCVC